uniref:Histone-lysine N-methyltransferase, H3 lysine-79 specific n=1 Tax=Globisporangium ultimum (strain ATCC 200006 / CBS 805.95 / DAOM BR144) TaxID=431595 RepID=K3X6D3_GLOUD
MLSPMKDATKRRVTPRKARISRKPQNLQSRLGATELSEKQVVKLIEKLYKEQEEDDRDMYNILTETVKEQTQCERSDVVEELSQMEFRRMLTYGEVSVESVSSTILPFLKLQADDVFYDLGCGSGKIVIQVALQTPCKVAKGIELMLNRVEIGANALGRLIDKKLPVIEGKHIDIVQGDICKPPERANMMDATVVFINNVCFGPELMLQVTSMLSLMPNLRRVVTLRKFCERHRPQKCMRAGNLCVEYVHPPEEAEIFVSWASKTSANLLTS